MNAPQIKDLGRKSAFTTALLLAAALFTGCQSSGTRRVTPLTTAPVAAMHAAPTAEAEPLNTGTASHIIFGQPQASVPVMVLENIGYVSAYDPETRTPRWVSYRLFANGQFESGERPDSFSPDERVENPVVHEDYTNTGYDRGHMAPNAPVAKRYGQEAQEETFLTTNIIPQLPGLNQRGWQALEAVISDDWAENFQEVWVITGPIFEGACWEFKTDVRIPSHCYMVIVDIDENDQSVHALGVIMEQRRVNVEPLEKFVVTVDEIEARTGIDFLRDLPDNVEASVESATADARWNIQQLLRPTFPGNARAIVRRACD